MSLWTPDGEHPVDREPTPDQQADAQALAAEMAQVRAQLSQVPAAVVVANHAMGCYELAAIHLSNQPPKFDEAQLAIDAFGALLGAIQGRLGPDEVTLNDALAQIRLAFVQVKASHDAGSTPTSATDATTEAGTDPAATGPDAAVLADAEAIVDDEAAEIDLEGAEALAEAEAIVDDAGADPISPGTTEEDGGD